MVALQPPKPADALKDLVHRILDAVRPRRIILFGSAARGEMTPHSDFNVLVVLADGDDPIAAELAIYRRL